MAAKKVRNVKGVPLSDSEYQEYRRLSHYDQRKAAAYLADRDKDVRSGELGRQNAALRKKAATKQAEEPRPYTVGDVALTEKQYKDYQQVLRTNPELAQGFLAIAEKPGQNVARKVGRNLNVEEMNNYEDLIAHGQKDIAELVYGKSPTETAAQARERKAAKKPKEEAEQYKRGLAGTAQSGSAAATEQALFRKQEAEARGNFAPSQRRDTYTLPATTQFLDAKGMPGAVTQPPIKPFGAKVPDTALVWVGSAGGIATPGKGHLADPDAPRGRNAPRETELVRSIDDLYGEIDDETKWNSAKIAKFQADQGLTVTGVVGDSTRERWQQVLVYAARKYAAGQKVSPYALMAYRADADQPGKAGGRGGAGGPGEPGGGPFTTTSVRLSNRGESKKLLDSIFKAKLGRGVTEDEVTMFQSALNASEKKSPITKVSQQAASGESGTETVSGGVDPEQFVQDYLMDTKGGEANARMIGVDYLDAALKAIGAPV